MGWQKKKQLIKNNFRQRNKKIKQRINTPETELENSNFTVRKAHFIKWKKKKKCFMYEWVRS